MVRRSLVKLRIIVAFSAVALGLGSIGVAGADPFLCPAVGNETAAQANGKGWGELPNDSYTFIPGNNQAGEHANENALNTLGPSESPGPGNGNSDWSPIWPD
jgi:hypothetical protein